jgi:hypothetical protein
VFKTTPIFLTGGMLVMALDGEYSQQLNEIRRDKYIEFL